MYQAKPELYFTTPIKSILAEITWVEIILGRDDSEVAKFILSRFGFIRRTHAQSAVFENENFYFRFSHLAIVNRAKTCQEINNLDENRRHRVAETPVVLPFFCSFQFMVRNLDKHKFGQSV